MEWLLIFLLRSACVLKLKEKVRAQVKIKLIVMYLYTFLKLFRESWSEDFVFKFFGLYSTPIDNYTAFIRLVHRMKKGMEQVVLIKFIDFCSRSNFYSHDSLHSSTPSTRQLLLQHSCNFSEPKRERNNIVIVMEQAAAVSTVERML